MTPKTAYYGTDWNVIGEMSDRMPMKRRARTVAPPLARPGMLAHLVDAANLITLGGLAISFFAC